MNTTVDSAVAAVGALIDSASREQVMPLYESVKGLICCSIPDTFSGMWIALSIGGMLAWFLVLLTFFYIKKLDALPRTDCCGCSCHTRTKYTGAVSPGPRPQPGMGADIWGSGAPAQYPPHYPPGDVEAGRSAQAVPIPIGAGWEGEGHVVAELVVRAPGGGGVSPEKKLG